MSDSPAGGDGQSPEPRERGRTVTATLPSSPVSSRLARELAREVLGRAEDPRVALVVTELVTNAVKHAQASPEVTLTWDGAVLRIGVWDPSTDHPTRRRPEATSTSGRGLALVEAIADRWGVEQRPDGKLVWAEVDLGASLDLSSDSEEA